MIYLYALCFQIFSIFFNIFHFSTIDGYTSLGCWKDTSSRAISILEGKNPFLDGSYRTRKRAIQKCFYAAKSLGYDVFAVQDGGQCGTSSAAKSTFKKYGESTACKLDGKGGAWANNVYEINQGIFFHQILIELFFVLFTD